MQPINVIAGVWQEGTTPHVINLTGQAFYEEVGAHRFEVSAIAANGTALSLSGTVTAKFLRADGTTVALDGSISDGKATVTLVSDCYHVPGRYSIAIYVTTSGVSTCVYAACGIIFRTSSDTVIDSGATIPTLAQLEAAYDECVEATGNASVWTAALMGVIRGAPVTMLTTDGAEIRVLSNGIGTSGADLTNTARARTQYFKIKPNTSYTFRCDADGYVIINAFQYTGTTGGSEIGKISDTLSDAGDAFYFRSASNAGFARVSFAHTDTTTAITDDDRAAILAGISLSEFTDTTLTRYGVPADAEATGDAVDYLTDLVPTNTVSWDEMGMNATGTGVVLGWEVGYWDNTNTLVTNATTTVCFWTYIAAQDTYMFNRNTLCKDVWITAPEGTTGRIKSFSGSSYTTLEDNITFVGTYHLRLNTAYRYRFHLAGLTSASEWLTAEHIRTIIIRYAPYDDVHKPSPGNQTHNQFFTVSVERPVVFADDTATTTTATVQGVLRMPNAYRNNGTPTRMVFMAHGAHGYIDSSTDTWYSSSWIALCTDLLEAGYGVFDCNVLPGTNAEWVTETGLNENWVGYSAGSPLYVQAVKAAYDYIVATYNVYPQIFVHGSSMGGAGATAFAHAFPQLVLAESGFAGRDLIYYINAVKSWIDSGTAGSGIDDGRFAAAWGYASVSALITDKWSHIEGMAPSLTLTKVNADGTVETAPDRASDFSGWLAWFADIYGTYASAADAKATAVGNWIGWRRVPYKAWNSWADNVSATELERFLRKAFSNGGCAYNLVEYDSYSHDDVCFGQSSAIASENTPGQLIAWFKRWE